MKYNLDMKARWRGIIDTVNRFPFTVILLMASVIVNAMAVNSQEDIHFLKLLVTFLLGASVYVVCQLLYERFFHKSGLRIYFMGISAAASVLYYLLIKNARWDTEITIRTTVLFFILLISFLWIPVINSRYNFNQSFMAIFKGFFASLFYTGILFAGVALIIGATNMLIFRVNDKAFIHAANIIFVLLAPVYFLSLIPYYSHNEKGGDTENRADGQSRVSEEGSLKETDIPYEISEREAALNKLATPARFLEALISYIIIPITAVFTIILLLYIIMNITGRFWADNLMEPLLISYSITVIIVYLLASSLKNAVAGYFRLIFPKVLVPVVLLQTLASALKIRDAGITYGRYFVILFGLFATVAGLIFCLLPVHRNGRIAPVLIILSLLSIVPPVDAFTVSRINQTYRLEHTLKENKMLSAGKIVPNSAIPEKDKEVIADSVSYLDRMGYAKNIPWLSSYNKDYDFNKTFGFVIKDSGQTVYRNVFAERDTSESISIKGYDYMLYRNFNNQSSDFETGKFEKDGIEYTLRLDNSDKNNPALLLKKDGKELIRFETNEIFNKYTMNAKSVKVKTEDVTFTKENSSAMLTVIADRINLSEWEEGSVKMADIYILISVK